MGAGGGGGLGKTTSVEEAVSGAAASTSKDSTTAAAKGRCVTLLRSNDLQTRCTAAYTSCLLMFVRAVRFQGVDWQEGGADTPAEEEEEEQEEDMKNGLLPRNAARAFIHIVHVASISRGLSVYSRSWLGCSPLPKCPGTRGSMLFRSAALDCSRW